MSDFTNEAIQVARRLEEIAERLADCDLDRNESDNLYYERAELEEKDRYLSAYFALVNKNQQLQTKITESEARVGRLEKAALISIHALSGGDAKAEVRDIYDETPAQSLQHIEAAAVEKFANDFCDRLNEHFGKHDTWSINTMNHAKRYCAELRQQQTNGE